MTAFAIKYLGTCGSQAAQPCSHPPLSQDLLSREDGESAVLQVLLGSASPTWKTKLLIGALSIWPMHPEFPVTRSISPKPRACRAFPWFSLGRRARSGSVKAVASNSSPVSQSMTLPIVLRALGAAHHARMLADSQGVIFCICCYDVLSVCVSNEFSRHLIVLLPNIIAMRSYDVSKL